MKMIKSKKDILVKTYLEYQNYINNLTDKNSESEFVKYTVKLFYELTDEQYSKLKYTTVIKLSQNLTNILNLEQELIRIFKFNNKNYGLIPNFDDMTIGEYIDCDTEDVVKQICVLYRPIIKKRKNKYKVEDYKADMEHYDKLKNELTCDIYFGFIGFFLSISQDLLNYTLNCLVKEEGSNHEMKKLLHENMDGYRGLLESLKMISLN
ncbi:hypothetical protein M0Q97_10250 [Candidatus Dojkabacteria bacterium]|jgi:hypothetical protein|nr:hypothetical protein [Candidatus Dojkabacteria bacterium]